MRVRKPRCKRIFGGFRSTTDGWSATRTELHAFSTPVRQPLILPKAPYPLEMQGRVLRVSSQQSVRFVQPSGLFRRKLPITNPKPRIGPVPHRSVQRPARRSSTASSPSASSRPAATSSSIWRSQAGAPNSANHVLNASSSAGVSRRTAASISFTPLMTFSLLHTVGPAQLAHPPGSPHKPSANRPARKFAG